MYVLCISTLTYEFLLTPYQLYSSPTCITIVFFLLTGTVWSLLTFWTPWSVYYYPEQYSILTLMVLFRILLGCLQGT